MKIREVLDKKVGEKTYTKFLITLPKEVVRKSKLRQKQLIARRVGRKIIIEEERLSDSNLYSYGKTS